MHFVGRSRREIPPSFATSYVYFRSRVIGARIELSNLFNAFNNNFYFL